MAKKIDERIKYKLSNFYRDNLKFENKKLYFGSGITLSELCELLKLDQRKITKALSLEQNQNPILTSEQIAEICINNNIDFEHINSISPINVLSEIVGITLKHDWPVEAKSTPKTPIVTIMGHVDHGKTTLLDTIRKTKVVDKEIGGITQKIGAYQVSHNDKLITFIDTPGHEAFTKMRANGSKITDMAIIVVAADDSVMPQTKESIEHAKAADVQIIVAINKIDKPGANPEKVKQQLSDLGLMPEEWGGKTPYVEISGLTGQGIDKLLEVIAIVSELKGTKAYENILAAGTVLESAINKQVGNTATLIVENGTLRVGDTILVDDSVSKIKSLVNDLGQRVDEAKPGTPVEIFGIGSSPEVGSKFVVVSDEKEANKLATLIKDYKKLKKVKSINDVNVTDLFSGLNGTQKITNIILKADGNGVLDALEGSLLTIGDENNKLNIVRKDVGEISTTDLNLAETSNAAIYTFALKTNEQIRKQANGKGIKIFEYNIIYKMFEDLEEQLKGNKEKVFEEVKLGEVEVKATFSSSKHGLIAGCQVKTGKVTNKSIISVTRKGIEIHKAKIDSLKFGKENVKERAEGYECGITVENFDKFEVGDMLIAFELKEA